MLLSQVVNGLTQGSLYALVAIGFVIIFGTMNIPNTIKTINMPSITSNQTGTI